MKFGQALSILEGALPEEMFVKAALQISDEASPA